MPSFLPKPPSPLLQLGNPLTAGLVGAWPMCEGSGQISTADLSGTNSPLLWFGAGSVTEVTWSKTPLGYGINYNGLTASDDLRTTLPDISDTISIGVVFSRLGASGSTAVLISRDNSPSSPRRFMYFFVDASNHLVWQISSGGTTLTNTSTTTYNDFDYHVTVGTFNRFTGAAFLYADGGVVASGTQTLSSLSMAGTNWEVGNDEFGDRFSGTIGGVWLWNRELSQAEAETFTYDPYAMFRYRDSQYRWVTIAAASPIVSRVTDLPQAFRQVGRERLIRTWVNPGFTITGASPVGKNSTERPVLRRFPVDDNNWVQQAISAQTPAGKQSYDRPIPKRYQIDDNNWAQAALTTGASPVGEASYELPVRKRYQIDDNNWVQQGPTSAPTPAGGSIFDLPRRPFYQTDLRTWAESTAPPSAAPVGKANTELPRRPRQMVDAFNWRWQITFPPQPIVPPSTGLPGSRPFPSYLRTWSTLFVPPPSVFPFPSRSYDLPTRPARQPELRSWTISPTVTPAPVVPPAFSGIVDELTARRYYPVDLRTSIAPIRPTPAPPTEETDVPPGTGNWVGTVVISNVASPVPYIATVGRESQRVVHAAMPGARHALMFYNGGPGVVWICPASFENGTALSAAVNGAGSVAVFPLTGLPVDGSTLSAWNAVSTMNDTKLTIWEYRTPPPRRRRWQ